MYSALSTCSRRGISLTIILQVGLQILPLDGNPHKAMALIAHPSHVSNTVCKDMARDIPTFARGFHSKMLDGDSGRWR